MKTTQQASGVGPFYRWLLNIVEETEGPSISTTRMDLLPCSYNFASQPYYRKGVTLSFQNIGKETETEDATQKGQCYQVQSFVLSHT